MRPATHDVLVAVQLVAAAGHALPGGPRLPLPAAWRRPARLAGAALLVAGTGVAVTSATQLGRDLTPRPRPRDGAVLRTDGPYALSRHPLYAGLLAASAGAVLVRGRVTTALSAAVLATVLHVKAGEEDRLLAERFGPAWRAWADRVPRLVGVPGRRP
ncbi:methyltransferase family protein [Aquipuribacter sp. SD81]|uniref:methyltransferase family protein n=1 Tax=Aquipuribacter sp. SD81 TaxID=3127703 RepID=UPI003018C428